MIYAMHLRADDLLCWSFAVYLLYLFALISSVSMYGFAKWSPFKGPLARCRSVRDCKSVALVRRSEILPLSSEAIEESGRVKQRRLCVQKVAEQGPV